MEVLSTDQCKTEKMQEGKEETTTRSFKKKRSINHVSPYNAGFCYVEKYKHDSNAKCVAV